MNKIHAYLKAIGITQALFASLLNVAWLTGFVPPMQLGPPSFAGRPSIV